jgi:hypothetical protein
MDENRSRRFITQKDTPTSWWGGLRIEELIPSQAALSLPFLPAVPVLELAFVPVWLLVAVPETLLVRPVEVKLLSSPV